MEIYFLPFLEAFVLSVLLLAVLIWSAGRYHWKARDRRIQARHIHQRGVTRWGGGALIVVFLVVLLWNGHIIMTKPLWGMVVAGCCILGIGLWDDLFELRWSKQLAFQMAVATAASVSGIRFLSLPFPFGGTFFLDTSQWLWLSLFLSVVWIVVVMNAVNWSDGIDGLCGGVAFIGFVTIFFLSLKPEVNQPAVGILSAILAGLTLGFLVFNIHPAKILAGTSGAWFFGFQLATLSLFAGTKVATTLLVLALPFLDAFWVVTERWRNGVSIFKADTRHIHYRLRELGWSTHKIVLFFYGVTTLVAIAALNTRALGKVMTLVIVAGITLASFIWIKQKTRQ